MPETDAARLREIAALIREGRDEGTSLSLPKAIALLGELPDGLRERKLPAQSLVRKAMRSGSRLELDRALTEVEQMKATTKHAAKKKPERARKKARRAQKR